MHDNIIFILKLSFPGAPPPLPNIHTSLVLKCSYMHAVDPWRGTKNYCVCVQVPLLLGCVRDFLNSLKEQAARSVIYIWDHYNLGISITSLCPAHVWWQARDMDLTGVEMGHVCLKHSVLWTGA